MQKLEHHVNSLSDARAKDEKYIRQLEKELMNCSQEIGNDSYRISFSTSHCHCPRLSLFVRLVLCLCSVPYDAFYACAVYNCVQANISTYLEL